MKNIKKNNLTSKFQICIMINGYSNNATENKITHQLVQLVYHELSPSKIHFYFLYLSLPLVVKCLKMTISTAKSKD